MYYCHIIVHNYHSKQLIVEWKETDLLFVCLGFFLSISYTQITKKRVLFSHILFHQLNASSSCCQVGQKSVNICCGNFRKTLTRLRISHRNNRKHNTNVMSRCTGNIPQQTPRNHSVHRAVNTSQRRRTFLPPRHKNMKQAEQLEAILCLRHTLKRSAPRTWAARGIGKLLITSSAISIPLYDR